MGKMRITEFMSALNSEFMTTKIPWLITSYDFYMVCLFSILTSHLKLYKEFVVSPLFQMLIFFIQRYRNTYERYILHCGSVTINQLELQKSCGQFIKSFHRLLTPCSDSEEWRKKTLDLQ